MTNINLVMNYLLCSYIYIGMYYYYLFFIKSKFLKIIFKLIYLLFIAYFIYKNHDHYERRDHSRKTAFFHTVTPVRIILCLSGGKLVFIIIRPLSPSPSQDAFLFSYRCLRATRLLIIKIRKRSPCRN